MSFELASALEDRKQQHLYRTRRLLESAQGPEVRIDGVDMLAFCSNDYLGLANHPEVVSAFSQAARQWGVGGGASHLVNGHHAQHHALEEELASFTGREAALFFSTGYMANIGAVNALLGRQDLVLEDRLNHASLLDAGLLSGARFQRYLHADVRSLEGRLKKYDARRKLVVTDGVFSMDGDLAPLAGLARVCQANDAWLMVDDAHGFGTVGRGGRGIVDVFGLSQAQVPVLVGTLGKAFGTAGAFVAGSRDLIETLVQHARSYIYTTAMPPALAAATRVSLRLLEQEEWRRERLQQLAGRFRREARRMGFTLLDVAGEDEAGHALPLTPIQPVLIGGAEQALSLAKALEREGILITAIRPPTVPENGSRLRVTFSASHTEAHLDRLLDALARIVATSPELLAHSGVQSGCTTDEEQE
ncbi:MAG: 8-amino-7-oxononanoate synthase [Hahellaceae bacterium]|nr:8-amino-7-oxononanoate synthase [Hahellaceae bacterium]